MLLQKKSLTLPPHAGVGSAVPRRRMRGVLCPVSDVFRQLRFASQLSLMLPQVRPGRLLSGLKGLRGALPGTSLTRAAPTPSGPVL